MQTETQIRDTTTTGAQQPRTLGPAQHLAPGRRQVEADKRIRFLPDWLRNPRCLIASIAIPQIAAAAANARMWHEIASQMTPEQSIHASHLVAGPLGFSIAACVLALLLSAARSPVTVAIATLLMVLQIAWLPVAQSELNLAIPADAERWLFPSEEMFFQQWMVVMVGLFHCCLVISSAAIPLRRAYDLTLSANVAIAAPAGIYFLTTSGMQFSGSGPTGWIGSACVISAVAVGVLAMLRFAGGLCETLRGGWIVSGVIGLAFPLSGLILNLSIPFPANFESPWFFGLATFTGITLLPFRPNDLRWERILWLLRGHTFGFTLYFFIVFLPFLPLAVPMLTVWGTGVLIAAPAMLMMLHFERLSTGFCAELKRSGMHQTIAALGIVVLALPGIFVVNSWLDRQSLRTALDAAFEPDYSAPASSNPSAGRLLQTLERLEQMDHGDKLPVISGFYAWMVADNMRLAQARKERLARQFLGLSSEQIHKGRTLGFNQRPSPRESVQNLDSRGAASPVNLLTLDVTSHQAPGFPTRTDLSLSMHNPLNTLAEYHTRLVLPPGVVVVDYWLDIEGQRVSGRLRERQAALFVYQLIRDTRRDPGLLFYRSPSELELRVFPFRAGETRLTGLTLMHPEGTRIEMQRVSGALHAELRAEPGNPVVQRSLNKGGDALLSIPANADLPQIVRSPHLMFIVDRSLAGLAGLPSEIAGRLRQLAEKFPEAETAEIIWAHGSVEDDASGVFHLDAWPSIVPPRQAGGFPRDHAIKRALVKAGRLDWRVYPHLIVVTTPASQPIEDETSLAWFAERCPDLGGYFVDREGALDFHPFDKNHNGTSEPAPVSVIVAGDALPIAVRVDPNTPVLARLPRAGDRELRVYRQESDAFEPLAAVENRDATFSAALDAWQKQYDLFGNPSLHPKLFRELITSSREAGVLLPSTAFIVVENQAQWDLLDQKERERLKGHGALGHLESPAPPLWLLLGALVCCGAAVRVASGAVRLRRDLVLGKYPHCGKRLAV